MFTALNIPISLITHQVSLDGTVHKIYGSNSVMMTATAIPDNRSQLTAVSDETVVLSSSFYTIIISRSLFLLLSIPRYPLKVHQDQE